MVSHKNDPLKKVNGLDGSRLFTTPHNLQPSLYTSPNKEDSFLYQCYPFK